MLRHLHLPLLAALWLAASPDQIHAGATWSVDEFERLDHSRKPSPEAEGFVLKSYVLHHLRVGAGPQAGGPLSLVKQLITEGGSLREDAASNSLHILSTPRSHQAIWDYLSSVDQPQGNPAEPGKTEPSAEALAGRVGEAIERLDDLSEQSEHMASGLRNMGGAMLESVRVNSSQRLLHLSLAAAALLMAVATLALLIRWRREARSDGKPQAEWSSNPADFSNSSGALIPTCPSKSPEDLHQEMMGVLNSAALRMEAWYSEQRALQEQAGASLVSSTADQIGNHLRRIEERGVQVESMALQLEEAYHDLDSARDQALRLQLQLESTKAELVVHQSKLCTLGSILVGEGSTPERTFSDDIILCKTMRYEQSTPPEAPRYHFIPPGPTPPPS